MTRLTENCRTSSRCSIPMSESEQVGIKQLLFIIMMLLMARGGGIYVSTIIKRICVLCVTIIVLFSSDQLLKADDSDDSMPDQTVEISVGNPDKITVFDYSPDVLDSIYYSEMINQQSEEISRQAEMIKRLSAELNAMSNSKSWKITKPLRDLGRFARKNLR